MQTNKWPEHNVFRDVQRDAALMPRPIVACLSDNPHQEHNRPGHILSLDSLKRCIVTQGHAGTYNENKRGFPNSRLCLGFSAVDGRPFLDTNAVLLVSSFDRSVRHEEHSSPRNSHANEHHR